MVCEKIEDCSQNFNDAGTSLVDKKGGDSKYVLRNNSRSNYEVIDFENCVYKNRQNDTKCDFGIKTKITIYYVELKGCKVSKGIKQLLKTIVETKACFPEHHKKARLVVSRFPRPDLVKKTKDYKDLVRQIGLQDIVITQKVHTDII